MSKTLMQPMTPGEPTFMGAKHVSNIDNLDSTFAVIGAPFGFPYDIRKVHYGASDAPKAVRAISNRYGSLQDRYDFDLAGEPFDNKPHPIRDLGDVIADPMDIPGNAVRVSEAVAQVLDKGCKPIVLGGDDSVTWMSIRGFANQEQIIVVQFDAHLDFRDEVNGIREGYSSPMRRASEASHVKKIIHVGGRGPGSGRREDYEGTLAAGNTIVPARDVRANGAESVLKRIPKGSRVYIAFDVDGMDPSVAPGTSAPLPGGLDFIEAQDIFIELARHHEIVGMNLAEHYPSLDVNGITSLVITRLIASWIGTEIRK